MGIYISLDRAKAHLNVEFEDDDELITELIELVEEVVIHDIEGLAKPTSLGSVTTAGTTALIGVGTTFTDYLPGDIVHVRGEYRKVIASISDDLNLVVTEAFTSSLSDLEYEVYTGVPTLEGKLSRRVYHAMKLMLSHFYENREPVITGTVSKEMEMMYQYLISEYKTYTIK